MKQPKGVRPEKDGGMEMLPFCLMVVKQPKVVRLEKDGDTRMQPSYRPIIK